MHKSVNRQEFLQNLESVQPGLSPRDIVQQSASFVFKAGWVITFNDEVACTCSSLLPDEFTGAVPAKPLVAALAKMPDKNVTITVEDGHFVVKSSIGKSGKAVSGRKIGVRMDEEITLPLDTIERPKKGSWKDLRGDFNDAVTIIQECASKDESLFPLPCIHIHPKWMEACDMFQMTRYKIATGVSVPTLIKQESLKSITALGMTEFAETPDWMHFRNDTGLRFSCRRLIQDYPDLAEYMEMKNGIQTTLPGGLPEAAARAEVFSQENADENQVMVHLGNSKIWIKGQGVSGYYIEPLRMNYNGPAIQFKISPKLLTEIVKRHNEIQINDSKIYVDGGKWVYISALGNLGAPESEPAVVTEAEEGGDE